MAALIGAFVGGLLLMYILSWLASKFVFTSQAPLQRAIFCTIAALAVAWIVSAFGAADGGPLNWGYGVIYTLPAIVIGIVRYREFNRDWREEV